MTPSKQPPARRIHTGHLAAIYLVVAIGVLVVLRASIDHLEFIGAGWLIVFAVVPLAPLLVDRFADLAKSLSPHVSSFKVGAVQIDLRDVRQTPIALTGAGALPAVPNDMFAFQATGLDMLISDLESLRRQRDVPVVTIDLRDGTKWKRLNLYLLARLLDEERYVQMVFTELRSGRDGYLVGTCRPADLVRQFEREVPEYGAAAGSGAQPAPAPAILNRPTAARLEVARLSALLQPSDHVMVGAADIVQLVGPFLNTDPVELHNDTLAEPDLRKIVRSRVRFTPATSDGRVIDIIDRDAVALDVARAALSP